MKEVCELVLILYVVHEIRDVLSNNFRKIFIVEVLPIGYAFLEVIFHQGMAFFLDLNLRRDEDLATEIGICPFLFH